MIEHVLAQAAALSGTPAEVWGVVGVAAIAIASVAVIHRAHRVALGRLDERVSHLAAGLSLLTNTAEEGLRNVAIEVGRLAQTAESAPKPPLSPRQRIAAAAGHGRSVQDIARSEELSEGEVLLHMLLEKLRPETPSAKVC